MTSRCMISSIILCILHSVLALTSRTFWLHLGILFSGLAQPFQRLLVIHILCEPDQFLNMVSFNINIIKCSNFISAIHIALHKLVCHITRIIGQIVVIIHYVTQRIASTESQCNKINNVIRLLSTEDKRLQIRLISPLL